MRSGIIAIWALVLRQLLFEATCPTVSKFYIILTALQALRPRYKNGTAVSCSAAKAQLTNYIFYQYRYLRFFRPDAEGGPHFCRRSLRFVSSATVNSGQDFSRGNRIADLLVK